MPKLVITDVDSDGNESATIYNVMNRSEAYEALRRDLDRTAGEVFTEQALWHWNAVLVEYSPVYSLDNGNGMSVRFEYLP